MVKIIAAILLLCSVSCTTINVTTSGGVLIDAHKQIIVSDPSANIGIPLL